MYKKLLAVCLASLFTVVIADGQVTYQIDNNTNTSGVGITGAGTYDQVWLNTFATQPGGEMITNISAAFGSPADVRPYNGLPISVLLYTDIDGGSPQNAVLLQQVNAVISMANTGLLANFAIPPTLAGTNFVVGIIARNAVTDSSFIAGIDETATLPNRSFFGFTAPGGTMDPANLGSIPVGQFGTTEGLGFPGNWVLRATGTAIPEPSTWCLLAVGSLGLTGSLLRRRARKA